MTSGPTSSSLGGLYVTVNLDVSGAIRQLARFDAAAKNAMRSLTLPGGRGLGTAAVGLNQVAKAVNNVGAATAKASGSMKGLQTSAVRLGGYARASTGPLREFERAAKNLGNSQSIVRGLTTAGHSLSNFRAELGNTAAILAPGRAGTAIYGLNAMGRALSQLSAAGLSGPAAAGLGIVTVAVIALGAALIGTGAALGKFLSIGLTSGAEFETLIVSMETLLGSASDAQKEINTLVRIGQESPFLTETVVAMDKFLISQGLAAGALRQGLIQSVLDMGAALGLADENLGSITYALAQVQARGYLSGDELRQLANQFVPVWEMLSVLPELAGKTRVELRKMAEEGAISAQMFQEAFILYSERYAGAAERQANTLRGVLQNIKDVAQAQIGLTFARLPTSPLFVLRDALKSILETLRSIDFGPLVGALGNLFRAFIGPFTTQLQESGKGVENFFQRTLPRAINSAAAVVQGFMQVFISLYEVVRQVVGAFAAVAPLIGVAFGVGFAGAITAMNAFVGAIGILIGAVRLAGNAVAAFFAMITGDMGAFRSAWDRGLQGAQASVSGFAKVMAAPLEGIKAALNVAKALKGVNLPRLGSQLGMVGEGLASLPEGIPGGTKPDKGGGAGAAKTAEELKSVMDDLYDLTRRWFGLRSELEKGLLGPEGFEASVDQIASMGQKLVEALRKLAAPEVAALVENATYALIALARRREELAGRLKDAEAALADAISARDSFAKQIRESTINFANALRLESETETRFRMVSERGFFIQSETERQKSFVETLKERVKALKDFLTNMKILRDRGLDQGLLQQLLSAGPEQAGEIAAGLAAGGQEMIAEVNVLQDAVQQTADQLAEFGVTQFHKAGVDQAQALVDGLQGEIKAVEDVATAITAVVYEAVLPWAQKLEETGAEAANAAGAGLASGIPAVAGAMGGMTSAIGGHADRWDKMMGGAVGNAGSAMDFEFDGILGVIDDFTTEGLEKITAFTDVFTGILEGMKFQPSGTFDFRRLRYNFFDSIIDWLADIPNVLKLVVFPEYFGLMTLLNGLRGSLPPLPAGPPVRHTIPSAQEGGIFRAPNGISGLALLHHNEMVLPADLSAQVQQMAGIDQMAAPEINVYIGDQELKSLVRTEVVYVGQEATQHVIRGRRT
jgi:tape measure domain-containing protein